MRRNSLGKSLPDECYANIWGVETMRLFGAPYKSSAVPGKAQSAESMCRSVNAYPTKQLSPSKLEEGVPLMDCVRSGWGAGCVFSELHGLGCARRPLLATSS
jgi:hypothetical protein